MKILVTGSKGFIGKNLVENLKTIMDGRNKTRSFVIDEIYEYDVESTKEDLDRYCSDCDFVFNFAGINRPKNEEEFDINRSFLGELLSCLKAHGNKAPVMLSSSIQAVRDNGYGLSKKAAEDLLFQYGKENDVRVLVYRFPNVFGKWCRPNYNSAVATFCNNIANELPIMVNDPKTELDLVYIDDIVEELFDGIEGREHHNGQFCEVPMTHHQSLGEIVDLIHSFHDQPQSLVMPSIPDNSFAKKLYSTYLSYLPKEKMVIDLKGNFDDRGSFTEFIRTGEHGQFSINVSKPGITKGQHWHNTKWEFFLVVSGHGLIQERKIGSDEVIEFEVTGKKLQAVHMLPGYTHNIINLSDSEDLVTVMWANEMFDPKHPDTFFEKV